MARFDGCRGVASRCQDLRWQSSTPGQRSLPDVTDRKVAEEHVKFRMGEITHRSKNVLSVVQAIASQTGRTVGQVEEFQRRFADRLQGTCCI